MAANFTSISNSLKNSTGSNIDRNQAVMLFIADPFFDMQGQSARVEFEITLLSHLQNYEFTEFSFAIIESKTIEPDVIDADTLLEVRIQNLTLDKTSVIDGHTYRSRSVIRWKLIDGSWKIYSGLPFRSSELFLKE
ncbi:MAG: hypothetical protein PHD82_06995 [Candidatus Riflebacteria bacterium]|nr:hypothetical protein [Candidatus Riflebacteria bacterium]